MSFFSYKNRRKVKSLLLCAVMLCSIAAQSVLPLPFVLAAGEEVSEEPNYPPGDNLRPQDYMEEYILYRWTPVTLTTIPADDKWHYAMFFRLYDGDLMGDYFSTRIPENLWLGTKTFYKPLGSDPNQIMKSGVTGWSGKGGIEDKGKATAQSLTHYFKNRHVYGVNDYGVDPNANCFYTLDDRDCPQIKRERSSIYRKHELDGTFAQEYKIKLKSTNEYDYYLWGSADESQDASSWALTPKDSESLEKANGDKKSNDRTTNNLWTIFNCKLHNGREVWDIVCDKQGHDAWFWASGSGTVTTFYHAVDDDTILHRFTWYNGERLRYSAFRSSFELNNHQILSITENDYINADTGDEDSQQGVILPAGMTITVNEGCVLSISGNFINNGTIEVNGGTLIIKNGGTIYPFLQGTDPAKNGCGAIKCLGGDIIIEEGGTLFAGLGDENGADVDFRLDSNSTLINQGLLVYGSLQLGAATNVELYGNSMTYGGYYPMAIILSAIKGKQNTPVDISPYRPAGFSPLLWIRQYSDSRGQVVSTYQQPSIGKDTFVESVYMSFVRPLRAKDMLVFQKQYFLDKKPIECTALKEIVMTTSLADDAARNPADREVCKLFGMKTSSENVTIKKAPGAFFHDTMASANADITGKMSMLSL